MHAMHKAHACHTHACHTHDRGASPFQAHSDFWGSRLGPVSALRFHPTQQLLATGAANDHLSVFSYEASSWTTIM